MSTNIFEKPLQDEGANLIKVKPSRVWIWADMARRRRQFHSDTEWQNIDLWGLFRWTSISYWIKSGKLLTNMRRENRTVWVKPSREAYHKFIEPLLDNYSLEDLTIMAGL